MANIPKRNRIAQALCMFFTTFIGPSTESLVGTILPDLMCIMDEDLKSASFLFLTYCFGKCFISFIGIFLKDRFDITLTMVTSLVIVSLLLCVIPNSSFLPLTLCAYLIIGVCTGTFPLGRFKLAGIIWPKSNYGYHLLSAGPATATLSTPLFASLFSHGNYGYVTITRNTTDSYKGQNMCASNIQFPFLILSVLALVLAVGFITNYYSLMNKDITLEQSLSEENDTLYAGKQQRHAVFVTLLLLLFGTITACMVTVSSLTVTYGIRSNLHLDVKTASYLQSLFGSCLLLSRVISTFLSDRIKPHVSLWFHLIIMVTSSALFIIYKDSSLKMLWVISALHGFGTGSLFPALVSWTRTRLTLSSRFFCIVMVLDNIGNMVHPTMSGVLIDMYGPNMFIYSIAGTRFLQFMLFGIISIIAYI